MPADVASPRWWKRWNAKEAGSEKHRPGAPSPRTSPTRLAQRGLALTTAALMQLNLILFPPPGHPFENLLPKTQIEKAVDYLGLPNHLRGTFSALAAPASVETCACNHRSYAELGDNCDLSERQAINNVAQLEALDVVRTYVLRHPQYGNVKCSFVLTFPEWARAQLMNFRAQHVDTPAGEELPVEERAAELPVETTRGPALPRDDTRGRVLPAELERLPEVLELLAVATNGVRLDPVTIAIRAVAPKGRDPARSGLGATPKDVLQALAELALAIDEGRCVPHTEKPELKWSKNSLERRAFAFIRAKLEDRAGKRREAQREAEKDREGEAWITGAPQRSAAFAQFALVDEQRADEEQGDEPEEAAAASADVSAEIALLEQQLTWPMPALTRARFEQRLAQLKVLGGRAPPLAG
jgi:hypothetical protein